MSNQLATLHPSQLDAVTGGLAPTVLANAAQPRIAPAPRIAAPGIGTNGSVGM